MITIRTERPVDERTREVLLDLAYGPARNAKPSAKLRRGRLPAEGLALVAVEKGRMIGSVRLWNIAAGRAPALLLGPLAVHPDAQRRGIGAALVRRALEDARKLGHHAVLLVGDAAYYGRFGFSAVKTTALALPGADPARLLALELIPGALDGAQNGAQGAALGRLAATGKHEPMFAARAAKPRLIPRAA